MHTRKRVKQASSWSQVSVQINLFSYNGRIWTFCRSIIGEVRQGCVAGLAGRAQHTVPHPQTVQIKLYHPVVVCQHNNQANKGLV